MPAAGLRPQNRIRRDRGASSSKKRRKSTEISGAHTQLSKAKVFAVRFLAHVYATKTLGTTGCRSPGHENLPGFSFSLPPSFHLSLSYSLGLPALTSFAASGSIFKCGHCRALRCGAFSEKSAFVFLVFKRECFKCSLNKIS